MASLRIVVVALAFLGITMSTTLATDYIVGDKNVWTIRFDYQAWAKGKRFRVGDKIIFNYPVGAHNVIEVDRNSFRACRVPAGAKILISGNDVVELKKPGIFLYICGVGKHCELGKQKLSIKVFA